MTKKSLINWSEVSRILCEGERRNVVLQNYSGKVYSEAVEYTKDLEKDLRHFLENYQLSKKTDKMIAELPDIQKLKDKCKDISDEFL